MRTMILLVVISAFMAACAAEQGQPTGEQPTAAQPTGAQPTGAQPTGAGDEAAVSIFDFGYDPATLTVSTERIITWTNDGAVAHTVTFDEGPDSGSLESGATYEHAFSSPGEYEYHCTFHPAMRGVVNVGP